MRIMTKQYIIYKIFLKKKEGMHLDYSRPKSSLPSELGCCHIFGPPGPFLLFVDQLYIISFRKSVLAFLSELHIMYMNLQFVNKWWGWLETIVGIQLNKKNAGRRESKMELDRFHDKKIKQISICEEWLSDMVLRGSPNPLWWK